jgi:hypothetical protein
MNVHEFELIQDQFEVTNHEFDLTLSKRDKFDLEMM